MTYPNSPQPPSKQPPQAQYPQPQPPQAQPPQAQHFYSQSPQAQPPFAQTQSGHHPYAQPVHGQHPYGQHQYGQNAYGQQAYYQPANDNTKTILMVVGGIVGLILICGVAFIGFIVYAVGSLGTDSTSLRTVRAQDGISEIQVPDNWATSFELNDDATIEAANAYGEKYVIVITEPKSDFRFMKMNDIKDYGDLAVKLMKDSSPLMSVSPSTRLKINGKTAVRYEMKGTVDGIKVVYWLTAVEGNQHFHQVLTWTLASQEYKNKDALEKVTNSFREK